MRHPDKVNHIVVVKGMESGGSVKVLDIGDIIIAEVGARRLQAKEAVVAGVDIFDDFGFRDVI